MLGRIHWLGHDGFRISSDSVIYIDPYQLVGGPTADLIIITHAHHDHCSPADIRAIQGPHTVIVAPADCQAKISGDIRVIAPGERLRIGAVEITAVPAYNIGKSFHPKAQGWVGYLVTVDGTTIYHAGDTDRIPEMREIRADIALLPVGGKYTMTAEEAAQAALDIRPATAIPMHYGSVIGSLEDAQRFCHLLDGQVHAIIKAKE